MTPSSWVVQGLWLFSNQYNVAKVMECHPLYWAKIYITQTQCLCVMYSIMHCILFITWQYVCITYTYHSCLHLDIMHYMMCYYSTYYVMCYMFYDYIYDSILMACSWEKSFLWLWRSKLPCYGCPTERPYGKHPSMPSGSGREPSTYTQ